ncbi:Uncharacterised protein [Mycobacteroides abscessus subsp. abscessus]|nr:Uncharacterised protein [Mycobacteroides abscessus subsp. abscessus]
MNRPKVAGPVRVLEQLHIEYFVTPGVLIVALLDSGAVFVHCMCLDWRRTLRRQTLRVDEAAWIRSGSKWLVARGLRLR